MDPLRYLPARAGVIAKRKPLPPPKKTKVARRSRKRSTTVARKQPAKKKTARKKAAPVKTVQLAAHDPKDGTGIANLIESEIPEVLPEKYQARMQKRKIALKHKKKKRK